MKYLKLLFIIICLQSCNEELDPLFDDGSHSGKIIYEAYKRGIVYDCCIYDGAVTILSIKNSPSDEIIWSNGETGSSIIVDSIGTYSAIVYGNKTIFNCSFCEYELIIPQAFTPNGDGMNDALEIWHEGLVDIFANFYDLNADLVYQQTNKYEIWFGQNNLGETQSSGVYFYDIRALFLNGEIKEYTGNVKLLK